MFGLLDSCFPDKRGVLIPVEAQELLEGKALLRCYLLVSSEAGLCFGNVLDEGARSGSVLSRCR